MSGYCSNCGGNPCLCAEIEKAARRPGPGDRTLLAQMAATIYAGTMARVEPGDGDPSYAVYDARAILAEIDRGEPGEGE